MKLSAVRDAGNFLLTALLYVGVLLALWVTQQ